VDINEKAFTSKEVSTTLNIGDSTLRKWSLSLEKHGYSFIRNAQNNRLFVEKDLVVLRHFQKLVQEANMPLDSASMVVVDRFKEHIEAFEGRTGIVPVEEEQRDLMRSDEFIQQLLDYIKRQDEHIQKQEHFNKELMLRVEKIESQVKDEERIKLLKESMKQRQLESNKHQEHLEVVSKQLTQIQQKQEDNKTVESLQKQLDEIKATLSEVASSKEKRGFWSKIFSK